MVLVCLTLSAYTAIVLCPLPALAQALGLLLTSLWVVRLWRESNCHGYLCHQGGPDDVINQWTFSDERKQRVDGVLVHQGYRSAGLLILALRANDGGRIHRVPIWRDSVTPLEYSYLNLQLLFNTERQERPGPDYS